MNKDDALDKALDLALEALENVTVTGPDDDGIVWINLPGNGTTGKAILRVGKAGLIAAQCAQLYEEQRTKAITAIKQARSAPVQEPVAFKIYKPTPPRLAIPNVRDAELPWVYDQDPSSGNVASMWVTPVQTLRSKS